MPAEFHELRLFASAPSGDSLYELTLDARTTPVAGTHERPGQYVKLQLPDLPGEEGVFAIASAPGDGDLLELLVKPDSVLSRALCTLPPGAKVLSTDALGRGFDVSRARGRQILLFATGSGISAVRSLLAQLRRERAAYGPISLYFGARTPNAFAYTNEIDSWAADDIEIVRTVSQPDVSGWEGLTGYVQSHIPSDLPMKDAVCFLCGQEEMIHGVRDALVRNGMPESNLLLNF